VTPVASPACALPRPRGDLPVPPLGGTPRLPTLHALVPPKRSATSSLGDASFEPSTRVRPSRSGQASHPSRGESDPPLPSRPRSPCWTWTVRAPVLANQDQWWAPLLPGGPTLMEFRPLSNRLAGASSQRRSVYSPVEPCGPRGASPRARRSVTGTPSTLLTPSVYSPVSDDFRRRGFPHSEIHGS